MVDTAADDRCCTRYPHRFPAGPLPGPGEGWSWRYPALSIDPATIEQAKRGRFHASGSTCRPARPTQPATCAPAARTQILILGNSHEIDGLNIMLATLEPHDEINFITFGTTNKCRQLTIEEGRFRSKDPDCQARLDATFSAELANRLDIVVNAAHKPYTDNKRIFAGMLNRLRELNPRMKVVTIGGYIQTRVPCARLVNETGSPDACALQGNTDYFAGWPVDRELESEFAPLEDLYIDRVGLLCRTTELESCRTRAPDGTPAFYDRHHHSASFTRMTGRMLARQYPDLLSRILSAEGRETIPDRS